MLQSLRYWLKTRRKSGQLFDNLGAARDAGIWPEARARPASFRGLKVLCARRDRFGDMLASMPLLARLRQAGAEVMVLSGCGTTRALLDALGVESSSEISEAGAFLPDWLFFLQTCRHLRAERHPERWEWLLELLGYFRGTPCAIPAWRKREMMSLHTSIRCAPWAALDRFAELERFGDALGLPPMQGDGLFSEWIAAARTSEGGLAINLSAGVVGVEDRREIPIEFWARVHAALQPSVSSCIVLPGDGERMQGFLDAREAGQFKNCELVCEPDIARVSRWLAQQRLLLSPETGLCHLARNLKIRRVVLSPPGLVPQWYTAAADVRTVCAKYLADVSLEETVEAARSLLS